MLEIFGKKFEENETTYQSLTGIYGIGRPTARKLCQKLGLCGNLKNKWLTPEHGQKIINCINKSGVLVDAKLKRSLIINFEREIEIKSYSGLRRVKGFPVRGQRTRSNARTARKKLK